MKWFLIISLMSSALNAESLQAATIQEICSLDEPYAEKVTTVGQQLASICEKLEIYPSPEAEQLGREIISSMTELTSFQSMVSEYGPNPDLEDLINEQRATIVQAQIGLATNLNRQMTPTTTARLDTERSRKTIAFFDKYQNQNLNDRNSEEYLSDLKEVIATSEVGRRAIDCFENPEDERISGNIINISSVENTDGTYSPERDESTNKYINKITLKPDMFTPMESIMFLTHEMLHSCDATAILDEKIEYDQNFSDFDNQIDAIFESINNQYPQERVESLSDDDYNLYSEATSRLEDYIRGGDNSLESQLKEIFDSALANQIVRFRNESGIPFSEYQKRSHQTTALSEVWTYKAVNVDMFKEFASEMPRQFCDQFVQTSWLNDTASFGQRASNIEYGLKNNLFFDDLFDIYSSGTYEKEYFYDLESGLLNSEFARKIDAAKSRSIYE